MNDADSQVDLNTEQLITILGQIDEIAQNAPATRQEHVLVENGLVRVARELRQLEAAARIKGEKVEELEAQLDAVEDKYDAVIADYNALLDTIDDLEVNFDAA